VVRNRKTKIDPVLQRQIDSVGAKSDQIEAVFSLDLPMKQLLDPTVVEETTHQVLKRAEKTAGSKPKGVNVFKNLGSFVVSADASFIREVIDDPQVSRAVANRQPKQTSDKPPNSSDSNL